MDKPNDLEAKYQKLATEYSKVRSQATVLKKAVLDEQARNLEIRDQLKKHEQTIRKHDQEMESLTFRNEQLTKRISVLQQELQVNTSTKKSKNKNAENIVQSDTSVLDEELQKKILENAELASSMADKDLELSDSKERISRLEETINNLEQKLQENETKHLEEVRKLRTEQCISDMSLSFTSNLDKTDSESQEKIAHWKSEAEKWQTEFELLRSKPQSNDELTQYYESRIRDILQTKQMAVSESKSLWAENSALYARLENLTSENKDLERELSKSVEELQTTTNNYKFQLDAMTEHLAAQNDKITKQCDEIQILRHKLSVKK